MTHQYGTTGTAKYGVTDCNYCSKKGIRIESMGSHLYKCHRADLIKNFQAYIKIPNWNQPLVNTTNKSYTFCFCCNKYYLTVAKGAPSKAAFKHAEKCTIPMQIAALKELMHEPQPLDSDEDVITLPNQPKSPKNIIINPHECPEHSAQIAELRAEIQKMKNDILEFMKNHTAPRVLVNEIQESCTECKEWSTAYCDKANEIADLKEKLGLDQ